MPRVQIIQGYKDLQLDRQVNRGEQLTVTAERAQQMLEHNVAVIITEAEHPEPVADLSAPLKSADAQSVETSEPSLEIEDIIEEPVRKPRKRAKVAITEDDIEED
jgi:hypothetical protein